MVVTSAYPWLEPHEIGERAASLRITAGQLKAPIDVVKICRQQDIILYEARFESDDISGLIRRINGKTEILVNENHHYNRQRYTIAHELGHFVLHFPVMDSAAEFVDQRIDLYRQQWDTKDKPSSKREEIQANMFAAELLMPVSLVKDAYQASSDIVRLARLFMVSPNAMRNRIANLGL